MLNFERHYFQLLKKSEKSELKKKTSKNCYLLTEQAASLHTGLHRLDKLFQVSIELLLFALYHTVFDARMIYQLCRIELIDNFPILKTFLRKDKF